MIQNMAKATIPLVSQSSNSKSISVNSWQLEETKSSEMNPQLDVLTGLEGIVLWHLRMTQRHDKVTRPCCILLWESRSSMPEVLPQSSFAVRHGHWTCRQRLLFLTLVGMCIFQLSKNLMTPIVVKSAKGPTFKLANSIFAWVTSGNHRDSRHWPASLRSKYYRPSFVEERHHDRLALASCSGLDTESQCQEVLLPSKA